MQTNNFSDTLVEEYDLFGKVFPFHDDLQTTVCESVKNHFSNTTIEGGSLTFLDIGAGYGFTTKLVAKQFPKARFLLNEFDTTLLEKSDIYLEGVATQKMPGDIEEVIKNIPDKSIDGIYTSWVLHNFSPEKRSVIFKEIGRILKDTGVFVNLEKVENEGPERTAHLAQAILDLEPFISKYARPDLFIEWVKHDLRDEESDRIFTDTEHEKLLTENGFKWNYVKHILLEKVVIATKI